MMIGSVRLFSLICTVVDNWILKFEVQFDVDFFVV